METVKFHFMLERHNSKETLAAIMFALQRLYNEPGFVKCLVSVDTMDTNFKLYDDRRLQRGKKNRYSRKEKEQ